MLSFGASSDYEPGVPLRALTLLLVGQKTCGDHTKAHQALPRCQANPCFPSAQQAPPGTHLSFPTHPIPRPAPTRSLAQGQRSQCLGMSPGLESEPDSSSVFAASSLHGSGSMAEMISVLTAYLWGKE